jgi:hypothetical protein
MFVPTPNGQQLGAPTTCYHATAIAAFASAYTISDHVGCRCVTAILNAIEAEKTA